MGYWSLASAAVLLTLVSTATLATGHGRLLHPPSRSSMWRLGFKTPRNYNDHELFCGGFSRQQRNGMHCGVCGDPYDSPAPRPNEMGGKYYTGIISDKYKAGEVRTITVELTANHRGFFEFKLCPVNGNAAMETEDCMTQHPIEVVGDGRRENESPYRYFVERPNRGKFDIQLRFPEDMTCPHCVFQWTYTAGNNWGPCANGSHAVGCGPQETFRGCADITIEPDTDHPSLDEKTTKVPVGHHEGPTQRPYHGQKPHISPESDAPHPPPPPPPSHNVRPPLAPSPPQWERPSPPQHHWERPSATPSYWDRPTLPPVVDVDVVQNEVFQTPVVTERPSIPKLPGQLQCRGAGGFGATPGMDQWCSNNCNHVPAYCPPSHCKCD